jgi:hypothetical protein
MMVLTSIPDPTPNNLGKATQKTNPLMETSCGVGILPAHSTNLRPPLKPILFAFNGKTEMLTT